MDSGGIPPPEVAISSTLKEMVKNKAIKLDPDESEAGDGKRSKRKSEKAKELSAAEKFNNFKKQRIENKGEGDIVDDLFKDFIAKKMKEIDAERGHGEHGSRKSDVAKSVKDFNKYLDKEIKHISVPSSTSQTKSEKLVSVKKEKEEPLPAGVQNNSENISENTVSVKQEREVSDFEGPSLPPLGKSDLAQTEESAPPVPVKGDSKKTMIGFKNFGIKLSLTSTELIKSGDLHKKGKRLEEGEVLSSENSEGSGSSTDDENSEGDVGDVSGTGSISDSDKDGREKSKKKKKKKKGKHKKKKKHKEKGKDEENEKKVLVVKEEKSSGSKRKVSITPKSRSKSPKKKGRSRSRSKERRKKSRSKSRSRRSRSRSESKRTSKRRSRSRSKHRRSRSRSRDRHRRSRSRSRSKYRRSRSRSRSRKTRRSPTPERFWRSKYGNFDAYQYLKKERDRERRHGKSRSRSRSPDREKDRLIAREKKRMEDLRLKIDKAKLREIAIKNAVEMAKTGVGPNVDVVLKAGGKSVEELTDFCKRISSKDMKKFTGEDFSSDEETTQKPASDDESALIHHPFKVKEAAIVMDIKNAKQLPVVTPAERLAQAGQLRLQFPVSSGSQHREKEWVPVEKPEPMKLGVSMLPSTTPSMVPPPGATSTFPPQETPSPADDKVFEEVPQEPVDISAIISERLSAVRKLAENPHDVTAKTILTQAQKKASQWANARMLPGQFIGSTGANIMSQEELIGPDKKRQAWLKKMRRKQRLRKRKFNEKFSTAVVKKILLRSLSIARKDVFTNAAPVKSGIGMLLLQKMGWKHGEGLGKNNEGRVDPLMLDVKVDRKGLVTTGEGKKGGGGGNQAKLPPIRDLSGKHPVSALVELCNKRKWGAPSFEVIHESGPDHKKNFLFKVKVNGVEYQPSIASNNKKLAKAQAATICLQEFGLVPKTV